MSIYDLGPAIGATAVGLPVLIGGVVWWVVSKMLERGRLRRTVYSNLDAAYENGLFEADGYCAGLDAFELAVDLTAYAEDCYHLDARKLVPYVRNWLFQKGIPCKN